LYFLTLFFLTIRYERNRLKKKVFIKNSNSKSAIANFFFNTPFNHFKKLCFFLLFFKVCLLFISKTNYCFETLERRNFFLDKSFHLTEVWIYFKKINFFIKYSRVLFFLKSVFTSFMLMMNFKCQLLNQNNKKRKIVPLLKNLHF